MRSAGVGGIRISMNLRMVAVKSASAFFGANPECDIVEQNTDITGQKSDIVGKTPRQIANRYLKWVFLLKPFSLQSSRRQEGKAPYTVISSIPLTQLSTALPSPARLIRGGLTTELWRVRRDAAKRKNSAKNGEERRPPALARARKVKQPLTCQLFFACVSSAALRSLRCERWPLRLGGF